MGNFKDDLTGRKFGRLTVIKYEGGSKWTCECDCGNIVQVPTGKLKSGHTRSCGCLARDTTRVSNKAKASTADEVIGRKYGYLEVIDYDPASKVCTCRCDCGNIGKYDYNDLIYKVKKSCGCKKKTHNNMGTRVCRECGKEFDGGTRAFYCPTCRIERKREQKQRYEENKRKGHSVRIGDTMFCEKCNKKIIRNSARQRFCADCAKINNKEVTRKQSLKYYNENKETINEKRRGCAYEKPPREN